MSLESAAFFALRLLLRRRTRFRHLPHAGKPLATLKCQEEPISRLGPDWFEKAGIKSDNEDFDFPD